MSASNGKHNDQRHNGGANNHKANKPDSLHSQDPSADVLDNLGQAAAEGEPEPTEAQEQETLIEEQENTVDALEADLKKMSEALEKEKKEYLFLMAEFDNFRKRTVKEKADIIRNASEKVMAGLLPIVDDFERGIQALKEADENDPARQGMVLIYNKLMKFMEQNGVKPIESTGRPFDPDMHEAIAMVPAPDESQRNMVMDTPTRGYTINDKVLRHAKVVVGQ